MYTDWTGTLPQRSDKSHASNQKKQHRLEPSFQSSGVVGRSARGLAHDAAARMQASTPKYLLRTSALFAALSPAAELELCDSTIERSFSSRNIIFREDDPIRFVDIILRGSVKITQLSAEGGEVILRIDRAGYPIDGMGEESEKVHTTTASAIRDCTLLSWEASVFSNFVVKFPVIQRNAMSIMAGRLRSLSQSFCDLSTAHVPQRLARALLRLAAPPCPWQQEQLGLSREELAQMVGTSLFTTSRLLREWAELGIVYVNRNGVTIENMDALVHLSLDRAGEERQESESPRSDGHDWKDELPAIRDEFEHPSDGTDNL